MRSARAMASGEASGSREVQALSHDAKTAMASQRCRVPMLPCATGQRSVTSAGERAFQTEEDHTGEWLSARDSVTDSHTSARGLRVAPNRDRFSRARPRALAPPRHAPGNRRRARVRRGARRAADRRCPGTASSSRSAPAPSPRCSAACALCNNASSAASPLDAGRFAAAALERREEALERETTAAERTPASRGAPASAAVASRTVTSRTVAGRSLCWSGAALGAAAGAETGVPCVTLGRSPDTNSAAAAHSAMTLSGAPQATAPAFATTAPASPRSGAGGPAPSPRTGYRSQWHVTAAATEASSARFTRSSSAGVGSSTARTSSRKLRASCDSRGLMAHSSRDAAPARPRSAGAHCAAVSRSC